MYINNYINIHINIMFNNFNNLLKKILSYFILIVSIYSIYILCVHLNKKINNIEYIKNNIKSYVFIDDNLKKTLYKDELIELEDSIAVLRNVFIYQWIEYKDKDTNKYVYNKAWVKGFVNSNNYFDKTKINNCHLNNEYKNINFIANNIKTNNSIVIDKKYYIDKIKYHPLEFKKNKIYYGLELNTQNDIKEDEDYLDPDLYVSSLDKKVALVDREKFKVVGNNNNKILFNGNNFNNPSICDIKIEYKIFNPQKISFFGNIDDNNNKSDNHYYLISFNDNINLNILIKKEQLYFFGKLLLFTNLIIFLVSTILNILIYLKDFTLKYIPFLNEYLIFSNKPILNTFIISTILFLIVLNHYIFIIIPLLILFILRQIDYCSI